MKKMNAYQAQELIKAWRADALWGAVADAFELGVERPFFPYVLRVRVLMGYANTLANNALWDEKWVTASKALQKYGIEHHSHSQSGRASGNVNRLDGMRARDFYEK